MDVPSGRSSTMRRVPGIGEEFPENFHVFFFQLTSNSAFSDSSIERERGMSFSKNRVLLRSLTSTVVSKGRFVIAGVEHGNLDNILNYS